MICMRTGHVLICSQVASIVFDNSTPCAPVVCEKLVNQKEHWKAIREGFLVGFVLA